MRRVVLAWLALLTATAAAPAQGWANKMFKDGATHDFGTVPRGAQLLHRFTMTNIYAVELEITDVRTSCGCAAATPAKKVLQPRETTTIDVAMDGRRFTGAKSIVVYVTVGPKFISTAELRVSASSRADVVFNPGQASFGVVNQGQTPAQTVEVEYAGALDWQVTEALAPDAPFTVELKELYRRRPPQAPTNQVGYQVKVTLKSDVPAGALKHEIHLKTNDPASPLLPLLVEATIQPSLTVSPNPLRFGEAKPGEALQKRVVLQGAKPFRVTDVGGLGDGLSLGADLSQRAATVQTLVLKFQSNVPGEFRKQLNIKTDLNDATPLAVEATVAP